MRGASAAGLLFLLFWLFQRAVDCGGVCVGGRRRRYRVCVPCNRGAPGALAAAPGLGLGGGRRRRCQEASKKPKNRGAARGSRDRSQAGLTPTALAGRGHRRRRGRRGARRAAGLASPLLALLFPAGPPALGRTHTPQTRASDTRTHSHSHSSPQPHRGEREEKGAPACSHRRLPPPCSRAPGRHGAGAEDPVGGHARR